MRELEEGVSEVEGEGDIARGRLQGQGTQGRLDQGVEERVQGVMVHL